MVQSNYVVVDEGTCKYSSEQQSVIQVSMMVQYEVVTMDGWIAGEWFHHLSVCVCVYVFSLSLLIINTSTLAQGKKGI